MREKITDRIQQNKLKAVTENNRGAGRNQRKTNFPSMRLRSEQNYIHASCESNNLLSVRCC